MLLPETLKRIRKIELKTRRLVESAFAGAYHAVFKGRGIAFDAVRPYVPGDDVRSIDWNVTARIGEPYIKQYVEERELTVMIVVDVSASMSFASAARSKRDQLAEFGAVLALSATTNNDRVGLLQFSDRIERYLPPRKGRRHVLRIIRDLLTGEVVGRQTDMALALRTVSQALKRRAIVFVISDFLIDPATYSRDFQALARKHDLIAVRIHDARERDFPSVGLLAVEDAEQGQTLWLDTAVPQFTRQLQSQLATLEAQLHALATRSRVDLIDLPPDGQYVQALTAFFQRRALRMV